MCLCALFVRFTAHSELSEQPLQMEQADASGRVVEPPVQADVSTAQEPCEVSVFL